MKISEFKKLEKKITGQNFGESYKGINVMMTVLSYLGNLGSIFLAYFFMSKVIDHDNYIFQSPYDSFMRKHLQHYGYFTGSLI